MLVTLSFKFYSQKNFPILLSLKQSSPEHYLLKGPTLQLNIFIKFSLVTLAISDLSWKPNYQSVNHLPNFLKKQFSSYLENISFLFNKSGCLLLRIIILQFSMWYGSKHNQIHNWGQCCFLCLIFTLLQFLAAYIERKFLLLFQRIKKSAPSGAYLGST